jgi:hypothetical protein
MNGKGDHFQKVLEYEDGVSGGRQPGGNSECHATRECGARMARVAIGYRCDAMVDLQFKDMSIRSIDPARPFPLDSSAVR